MELMVAPRVSRDPAPDRLGVRAQVTESKWMQRCAKHGALWCHNGKPDRPHALLTGGNHTDCYFNIGVVGENPSLLDDAAADLVDLLVHRGLELHTVDRVIGPAMGAITLADAVARNISKPRDSDDPSNRKPRKFDVPCLTGYTEKRVRREGDRDIKIMLLSRLKLRPNERVLIVDDVRSRGHTANLTAQAVTDAGGTVLPYRGMLVNRSGEQKVDGIELVALVSKKKFPMYPPDECPLCKAGSTALRPKESDNWEWLIRSSKEA